MDPSDSKEHEDCAVEQMVRDRIAFVTRQDLKITFAYQSVYHDLRALIRQIDRLRELRDALCWAVDSLLPSDERGLSELRDEAIDASIEALAQARRRPTGL